MDYNQVLCTADGVVYAAAGQGEYDTYFLTSQSWSLFAVDISTGKRLWTKPLPTRPDKSDRLYFLTARVVGNNLVALQETNDGKVRVVVRDTRTGAVRWEKLLPVPHRTAYNCRWRPTPTTSTWAAAGCGLCG